MTQTVDFSKLWLASYCPLDGDQKMTALVYAESAHDAAAIVRTKTGHRDWVNVDPFTIEANASNPLQDL